MYKIGLLITSLVTLVLGGFIVFISTWSLTGNYQINLESSIPKIILETNIESQVKSPRDIIFKDNILEIENNSDQSINVNIALGSRNQIDGYLNLENTYQSNKMTLENRNSKFDKSIRDNILWITVSNPDFETHDTYEYNYYYLEPNTTIKLDPKTLKVTEEKNEK